MQEITHFLLLDENTGAAGFHSDTFLDATVGGMSRCGEVGPGHARTTMTVTIRCSGQEFIDVNSEPRLRFTAASSFAVNCETQAEVDDFWAELSLGGEGG